MQRADYLHVARPLPRCAGGFQGFVRGSAAHRNILLPVVSCSLAPGCMAAGKSQDQGAFTLAIRRVAPLGPYCDACYAI